MFIRDIIILNEFHFTQSPSTLVKEDMVTYQLLIP